MIKNSEYTLSYQNKITNLFLWSIFFSVTAFPFMMISGVSFSDKLLIVISITMFLIYSIINKRRIKTSLMVLAFIFVTSNIVSSLLASNVLTSFPFTFNYLLQIILFLNMALFFQNSLNNRMKVLKYFYLFGFLLSIIGIIEKFYFYEMQNILFLFRQKNYQYERVSSLFDNPNHLGIFLSITFLIGLIFILVENKFKFIIPNLFMLTAVIFTGTRMALLLIFIGIIIIANLLIINRRKIKGSYFKFLLILNSSFLLVFIILFTNITRFSGIIESIGTGDFKDVTGNRLMIWQSGLISIKENLFLGVGNGNFISNVYLGDSMVTNPHSLYLALLIENGIIGFISFFGILFISISNSRNISNYVEAVIFKTLVPILLISQITEMQLYNVFTFILLFWFIFAMPFQKKNGSEQIDKN